LHIALSAIIKKQVSDNAPCDLSVILAAGGGRRIGGPKGLLALNGAPLLLRHVEAHRPNFSRVVVVLGADHLEHVAFLPADVLVVHNPKWASTWPADSLRLVLQAHPSPHGALVTPVDTPPAQPQTLLRLLEARAPCVPRGPTGMLGHPALLDAAMAAGIRARAPDGGLRALLQHAMAVDVDDPWVHANFNTPADWRAWTQAVGDAGSG
jgi:nicotine blue oxidoreductase